MLFSYQRNPTRLVPLSSGERHNLTTPAFQMLEFIQSVPNVIDRLLNHIQSPPFVELIFRIVQLDEQPGNLGVIPVGSPILVCHHPMLTHSVHSGCRPKD